MTDQVGQFVLFLDVETCGVVDLKRTGARAYAQHPDTDVILWAYQLFQVNAMGVLEQLIEPVDVLGPHWISGVVQHIKGGCLVVAHNCGFERAIWEEILTPRYSWPDCPDLTRWRDTMAMAAFWGLPLGLEDAGMAAGLSVTKDVAGSRLMKRMARPRKVEDDGTIVWWHQTSPDKLWDLAAYCRTDVAAMAALYQALPGLPAREQAIWRATEDMNDRGMVTDPDLIVQMIGLAKTRIDELNAECNRITGGAVKTLTAVASLRAWILTGDPELEAMLPDLQQKTVTRALEKIQPYGRLAVIHRLLSMRQQAARSSIAKLKAMQRHRVLDGTWRVHGSQVYGGANRTMRWAGRGIQPHNYPRPARGLDIDQAVELILGGTDGEGIELFCGTDLMTALSSCLRACLVAPPGCELVVADYSAIEARVLPWLAGEQYLLNLFEQDEDVYVRVAADLGSSDRAFGKLCQLSLGYQTGADKLRTTALDDYGIYLSQMQAAKTVADWRQNNKNICWLWHHLNTTCVRVVRRNITDRWEPIGKTRKLAARMQNGHLYIRLPSMRKLIYRDAEIGVNDWDQPAVTFMGVNSYTRKWERLTGYGGLFCNNVTQGTARDVMAEAVLALNKWTGLQLRLTVHDELVLSTRQGVGVSARQLLGRVLTLMSTPPKWAQGLPLKAEGYVSRRFKKG